jgi:hypothetical protein
VICSAKEMGAEERVDIEDGDVVLANDNKADD